jgi:hypothetical protein
MRKSAPILGAAVVTVVAVAGCSSSSGGTGQDTGKAKSEASQFAASGTAKLTEAQARQLAAQCLPGDAKSGPSAIIIDLLFHKSQRQAALQCAEIPKASWQAAANCLVSEHKAHPVPKADSTEAQKDARREAVVSTLAPCIIKYHKNASTSPSAVPVGTPATATPSTAVSK